MTETKVARRVPTDEELPRLLEELELEGGKLAEFAQNRGLAPWRSYRARRVARGTGSSGGPVGEAALVADMRRHAGKHTRFGYRRVWALLRRDGWRVSKNRIQRLWRQEGLRGPRERRKRRRLGTAANACTRYAAEHPNYAWSYDFVMDRTEDGRRLKLLTVVDEFTRECLAIHVARNITAEGVIDQLALLFIERGAPGHTRSDNGPEFMAQELRGWLAKMGSSTLFIVPGSPWQNAYIESFKGQLRDEMLDLELFSTIHEARYLTQAFRIDNNQVRPHSGLGCMTPEEFAATCSASGSASLRLRPRRSEASPTPRALIAPGADSWGRSTWHLPYCSLANQCLPSIGAAMPEF